MQQSLMIDATMAEQSIAPPRRSPTRALLTGLLAVAAVVALYQSDAIAIEQPQPHMMGWLLSTIKADGFAIAPAAPRSPATAPTAPYFTAQLGEQLDTARDQLEKALHAGSKQDVTKATGQLQALLALDDVSAMDAQLNVMARRGEIDSGFFYALARNMELAREAGDGADAALMWHLHNQLAAQVEQAIAVPNFEETLTQLLAEAKRTSMAAAVHSKIGKLDMAFMPELEALLEQRPTTEIAALKAELERRSAARFARAQQQLGEVLAAGDLEAMAATIRAKVAAGEMGASFIATLANQMEVARSEGKQDGVLMMRILTLKLQEALEAEPAKALVRELTRSERATLLLRQHLAPQDTLPLPAGQLLAAESPVSVSPNALAAALDSARSEVRGSQASLEALRRAAEDARSVLEEVYDDEAVDSFKAALPWAFAGQAPRRFRARAGAVSMMAGRKNQRANAQMTTGLARSAILSELNGAGKIISEKIQVGDKKLAGDIGFDPLKLSKDPANLAKYREAEIRHARLAMLAAFGWPTAEVTNFGNLLLSDGRAPSLLNGGLENINIGYWAAVIALAAGAEASSRNVRYIAGKNPKLSKELVPGDLGVDPFNADSPANREAEIWNGRIAMLAITAFAFEEFITKAPIFPIDPCIYGWCLPQ